MVWKYEEGNVGEVQGMRLTNQLNKNPIDSKSLLSAQSSRTSAQPKTAIMHQYAGDTRNPLHPVEQQTIFLFPNQAETMTSHATFQ